MLQILLFLVLGIIYLICYQYFLVRKAVRFFESQGIPVIKPIVPIFGTYWNDWKYNAHEQAIKHVEDYGPIYGTIRGSRPCLNITDPHLMRKILLDDAKANFFGRCPNMRPLKASDIGNKSMPLLVGTSWAKFRTTLVSSLSSAELKLSEPPLKKTLDNFYSHCDNLAWNVDGILELDMKNECMALCAEFMVEFLTGQNEPMIGCNHPFVRNVIWIHEGHEKSFMSTLAYLYPNIGSLYDYLFGIEDLSQEYFDKYAFKAFEAIKTEIPGKRMNFLGKLNRILENEKLDKSTVIAQLIGPLNSTFDIGSTVARVLHCLAMHPDIQSQVRSSEVQSHQQQSSSSKSLLNRWIKETLRLYPQNYRITRKCFENTSYKCTTAAGKNQSIHLHKGLMVQVPTFAIHQNPTNYKDSDKFNPNRPEFDSPESNEILYLAFGKGLRNCPAQYFAQSLIQMIITNLLQRYEFIPVAKTVDPLHCTSNCVGYLSIKNIWLGIRKIADDNS